MLINTLSLKNFKCFEELDVKFAPITLLTGANSSGKSSLINAILAVLQTEQFPFYLSPNGKYVNMGSYEEMVFSKVTEKGISLKLNLLARRVKGYSMSYDTLWKYHDGLPILGSLLVKNKTIELTIALESNGYKINLILLNNREVEIFQDQFSLQRLNNAFRKLKIKGNFIVSGEGDLLLNTGTFSSVNDMIKYFLIPALDAIRSISLNGLGIFSNALEIQRFNYIGSFRQPPDRTYYQKAKAQPKIDTDGGGYIDQIIDWEETRPDKLAELNEAMQQIKLFTDIQSNKLKGGRFELNLKINPKSSYVSLTDVGFGISQFLPIVVADLQLPDDSCLAVSQPEIHLHPPIQATFGNYLANQIKRTQKQYIIETHSEYLLNRIRLLLVTGELKPGDVRVLYFENDGVKSTVHDVEFATDGQVKGAPQGFFDTYGIDVMNIAMNAIG